MFPFGKIISGIPWASAKPITMGTSTVPTTLAASEHAMDIYTTSADTTATVNAFQLKSTTTGRLSEDQTMKVESYTTVFAGNENTVGHFYSNWVGTGIGPIGLASAVTAKMLLPTTCAGAFFAFYGKMIMPASPGLIDPAVGAGNSAGWFLLSTGGSGQTNFSDYGRFMEIHNITAGAGKMLSLHGQTLRCAIPSAIILRYLMLSQEEDRLALGVTGDRMALTAATTKAIRIYSSTTVATATQISSVEINQYRAASSSANGRDWGLKVNMSALTGNYKYPSGVNAVYGAITLGTGGAHGRGAALQGEMIFPAGQLTRGTFSCCTLEITEVSGTNTGSSGPTSFLSMVIAGATNNFNTRGYIFEITGLSTTDGGPFFVNAKGACDAMLKILIGGVDYFIPLATDDDSNWNAT